MSHRFLFGLFLLFSFSCDRENIDDSIKTEKGTIWISGGLAYCSQQIRLDNGNNLVVKVEDIISFKSGDRVNVKFKEIGQSKTCSPNIDCEIIKINKIE